jgi:hypothetical protein
VPQIGNGSVTRPIERLERLRAITIDLRSAYRSSRQTLSGSMRQPIGSRQERCSAGLGNEAARLRCSTGLQPPSGRRRPRTATTARPGAHFACSITFSPPRLRSSNQISDRTGAPNPA